MSDSTHDQPIGWIVMPIVLDPVEGPIGETRIDGDKLADWLCYTQRVPSYAEAVQRIERLRTLRPEPLGEVFTLLTLGKAARKPGRPAITDARGRMIPDAEVVSEYERMRPYAKQLRELLKAHAGEGLEAITTAILELADTWNGRFSADMSQVVRRAAGQNGSKWFSLVEKGSRRLVDLVKSQQIAYDLAAARLQTSASSVRKRVRQARKAEREQ